MVSPDESFPPARNCCLSHPLTCLNAHRVEIGFPHRAVPPTGTISRPDAPGGLSLAHCSPLPGSLLSLQSGNNSLLTPEDYETLLHNFDDEPPQCKVGVLNLKSEAAPNLNRPRSGMIDFDESLCLLGSWYDPTLERLDVTTRPVIINNTQEQLQEPELTVAYPHCTHTSAPIQHHSRHISRHLTSRAPLPHI